MHTRIASAGTGKTTALVTAIAERVLKGTPLRRIAAATFTRRSAADLHRTLHLALEHLQHHNHYHHLRARHHTHHQRLQRAREELAMAPIGTIHALMRHLLRLRAPELGLDPEFEALNEHDALRLYLEELTTLTYLEGPELNTREREQHQRLFQQRSLARAYHPRPDDPDATRLLQRHERVMRRYHQRLDGRALAPADIELASLTASDDPHTLKRWRERLSVAYIDEAQDVSVLQAELIHALARAGIDITLIGDPKQSIYAWRAASVESFRDLLKRSTPQTPLTRTYRHTHAITHFLNRLTNSIASHAEGFTPDEAPEVRSARPEPGSVHVLWSHGDQAIAELRQHEAAIAAAALKELHQREHIPYRDMAILIRASDSEPIIRAALAQHGIPTNRVQGSDYYQRPEVRTVLHALRYMLDPSDPNRLAPLLLASPIAPLDTNAAHLTLQQRERALDHLTQHHPRESAALQHLARLRDEPPERLLEQLLRAPLLANGERLLDTLDQQALDNLEALQLTLTRHSNASLESLTQRLEHLVTHERSGSVPQTGDGVRITTFHASKGLEWRAALVFDLGRGARHDTPSVLIEPQSGAVACRGSDAHNELAQEHKRREQHEAQRLLYVAMSRAGEHLLISASRKTKGSTSPAIRRLEALGYGPNNDTNDPLVRVTSEPHQSSTQRATNPTPRAALERAPWSELRFEPPQPLVQRPSHARQELAPNDPASPPPHDLVPALIGILTHHAIGREWRPDNPRDHAALASQSALAPLTNDERARVLNEVETLLKSYHDMRERGLLEHQGLQRNDHDVPFLYRDELDRVWQGTIDQVLKTRAGEWIIRDYKTDARVQPERHAPQLRLYARAATAWIKRPVRGELVYLRAQQVVPVELDTREALY